MRVIVAATGTSGDIFPAVGFAKALRGRGHDVLVATSGNFEQQVRDAGLQCIELCDAATYEVMRATTERAMAKLKYYMRASQLHESFFRLPELLFRAVEQHYVPGQTVLAATESFTVGAGSIAYEKLGIPYVSLWHNVVQFKLLQPWLPARLRGIDYLAKDQFFRLLPLPRLKSRVNQLRMTLGLPRVRSLTKNFYYSQQLSVCLFPRWYINEWYRDRFPNTILTDFPLYEPGQDEALPASAEAFLSRGSAPVVFNTASWKGDRHDYFEVAFAACRSQGVRSILLGPGSDAFAGRSDSVYTADYLSYERLLPRAAAFVNHGGIGSIVRGFAAGIPQLIVPQKNDTRFNGAEVERLRACTVLQRRDYAARLPQKLHELLNSEAIRAGARNLAERFAAPPDFSNAGEAIERLLTQSAASRADLARGWGLSSPAFPPTQSG